MSYSNERSIKATAESLEINANMLHRCEISIRLMVKKQRSEFI
jgi:hypothetical protein